MTSVAVLTSIYGDYDLLTDPPEQSLPCEWVAVVDHPHKADGWRQVVEPRPHMHPRLAAKVAKCLPNEYTDAEVTIWLDGSARILSRDFVAMCLEALGDSKWAQWVHPERDCIYAEAEVSMRMLKYQGQPCREQVEHYRKQGHPDHGGLWATGCIVRCWGEPWCFHDDHLFGERWLAEQMRWSYQDQLSEAYLIRELIPKPPAPLPQSLWRNEWVEFGHHLGGDT